MMTSEQLKASILQLAMQGKLVEQRPEEGTGEELYRKTIKRKGSDSNLEEYPIDIPETWYWVQVDKVCDIYTGNSISENVKKNKYMKDIEGYPYIATKDVQFDSTVEYDNGVIIPFKEDFRHAYKGAVLMCIEGGSAGRKIALIDRDVCFGNKLCMFYSLTVSNHYIYYYLQSPLFQSAFRNGIAGIIGGVSIKKIKSMWIPLPPLAEQKRIVAKIEELMPFVEQYAAASTKLNTLNATFPDMMKKSILQEAVQGKLVPQDPNDEPASVLLKKIAEEKKRLINEGKIKKQKPLPEITEGEIPFDIPESWEWVRFTDIAETCLGKMLDKTKNKGTFFPYIRNVNVRWGEFDVSDLLEMKFDDEGERFLIRRGDLVVCEGGEPGRCAVWNSEDSIRFQKALHRIRFISEKIEPMFYYYVLRFYTGSGYLARFFTGTTIKHLPGDKLNKIIVPFPPIGEQKRIVQEILRYNPYLMMLAQ